MILTTLISICLMQFLSDQMVPVNGELGSRWITKNTTEQPIQDNVLLCNGICNALWQDGDGVNSGEHYWKIVFESEESDGSLLTLNFTTKEEFEKEDENYSPCCRQTFQSGDTIRILASFSDDKLKVYMAYNNQPLGEVFGIENSFENVYPSLRFAGLGRLTITKETELPLETDIKDLKDIVGIEGHWTLDTESTNFGTGLLQKYPNFHFHKNLATLAVQKDSVSTIGVYKSTLIVINTIQFQMRTYDHFWRSNVGVTSLVGGPSEYLDFEYQLSELAKNPDSFEFADEKLVLKKGDKVATFIR